MAAAIGIITLGIIFVYSALKGIGVTDILAGVTGDTLDPKGGRGGTTSSSPGGTPASTPEVHGNADPQGEFKGPNAAWLRQMDDAAKNRFDLRRSQLCRPANAGYGSPTSLHKECRAGDYVGSVANRVAFARFAKANAPAGAEVFCDQAGMVAPGYDHSDHVHVGA